jgi:head-tail adaptor
MRIGELNTLVMIQHKTREQDDVLNKPAKWEEFAQCWCSANVPTAGGESQPNQQTIAQNIWSLETHWSPKLAKVTAVMRVVLPDQRVLGIKSVVNDRMQNRKLIITCEELG